MSTSSPDTGLTPLEEPQRLDPRSITVGRIGGWIFVLIMAVSFVITTILGVIMAIKHGGNRRAAYYCLAFGVAFPIALVLIRAFGMKI